MSEPPSGRQYTIVHGADRAVVVEVGGGLRSYVAGGRELLDGYGEHEMADSARGQLLVPWPNRLRDGRYSWDGTDHLLSLSEPEKGNALHGLVRFANWECSGQTTSRVEMAYVLHPQPGYPFTLALVVSYEIDADGLRVTTKARNLGTTALPYASGQHPYLSVGTGLLDACTLAAPGATVLPTDDRGIPTGRQPVDGTEYDFRTGRPIGATQLDEAFTDLDRDDEGRSWVRLSGPDGGASVWLDGGYRYLQLYTGDSLPDPDRRRRGLGVEPMTAPPNALASGTDVLRLEPGEETTASWGIQPMPG